MAMDLATELKAALTERDNAIAGRLGSIETLLKEHGEKWSTLEKLQADASSVGQTAIHRETRATREHKARFEAWLRRPRDGHTKQELENFERIEGKAVQISTQADGGFAVPEEIAAQIERLELKLSPVRSLVKVMKVGTSDFKHLVDIRGAAAGWVGENTAHPETATSQLREIAPTMGELYAYPQTTEWALDDVLFDVSAWLAESAAEAFALNEGDAVIRGNATNKPTGMLNTAPTSADDAFPPTRNAAAYQYVASGTAAAFEADDLFDLLYKVNATYRANAVWVMNSATAGFVRKFKDSQNQYLWAPTLAAGQPDSLLGYPVVIWEQMDAHNVANNHPIAFGDFSRGYLLVDRVGLRITVDANITTPGRIKYFIRRREGGHVLNNDAIKFLKNAVS
jgi:HK97 family phage major capsid protein